jgi:hypothetical protein
LSAAPQTAHASAARNEVVSQQPTKTTQIKRKRKLTAPHQWS